MRKSLRGSGGALRLPLLLFLAGLVGASAAQGRDPRLQLSGRSVRLPDDPRTLGSAPARRDFPHLLMAFGSRSRPSFVPTGDEQARLFRGPRGNAAWSGPGGLPPSCLPDARRERARALLQTPTQEEFLRLQKKARLEGKPDTVRILAMRVDFLRDSPGRKTTGDGRFDLRRDEEARAAPIDPPPHDRKYFESHLEALARYYRVISGGALELEWDIYPVENDSAFHLPDTRKYGPWIFSNSNPDVLLHAIDLVGDALAAADSADAGIDFSRYESFLLFHAGADFQGDINQDTPWDIPSFNLFVADPFWVQDSTVAIDLVQVVPEAAGQDGFYAALNGVVTHEFGHQLGFTDLYDVRNGLPVVGAFSLMDSGENLFGTIADPADSTQTLPVRGTLPASLDPWHKVLFFPDGIDLLTPEDFLSGDAGRFEAELPSVQLGNRLLFVPLNIGEYLLAENRIWDLNADSLIVLKQDRETGVILGPVPADSLAPPDDRGFREYDYLLPAEGLVFWHIDNAAINAGLDTPYGGVNIFFRRPGVAVVEADGIRDIGTASTEFIGGPYDTWYLGGYSCLTPNSTPSSATNDGTPTGLSVCALDSIDVVARVSVESRDRPAGWPVAFTGVPKEEQLLPVDLDGDGAIELLAASEDAVVGFRAGGEPLHGDGGDLFARFPTPVEGGIAGHERFRWGPAADSSRAVVVALVAGGALRTMRGSGEALPAWPSDDPARLGDSLVTCTPVVLDSLLLVGSRDGRIRALAPGRTDPVIARFEAGRGEIVALGAGFLLEEGFESALSIFYLTSRGERGALRWSGRAGDGAQRVFSVAPDGSGAVLPSRAAVLALAGGASGEGRFLFAWGEGQVEWRRADGSVLPGWPVRLRAPLAGAPIVSDADADGELETFALTRDGWLHCLGANGVDEFQWPRRIWSEDVTDPPEQTTGPRSLDVDRDHRPEILIHRADGFLLALRGDGGSSPGWPRAFGSAGRAGPEWIPAGSGHGPRLALGNALGRTEDNRPITAVSLIRVDSGGDSVGSFAVPGVDRGRARTYPRSRFPGPPPPVAEGWRESIRLYPNPLSQDQLTVRYVLDRPAQVTLQLFDLAGTEVARLETPGTPGPGGQHLRWDLSGVASGLYHVRIRSSSGGSTQEHLTKLAVAR